MKDGSSIRQEREINDIQTRSENLKLYLLAEDMINYIEKFQASTKKLLELLSSARSQATRSMHTKTVNFCASNEQVETEIKNGMSFTITKERGT